MDDDDDQVEDMDEPRQGPPGRAALIRERHEAMLARKRQGHSRLPPGVVPERIGKAPAPLRTKNLRAKHIDATPDRDYGSQTIVKHTSEQPAMFVDPIMEHLNAWQQRTRVADESVADACSVATVAVAKWRAGTLQPSEKAKAAILALMRGQPARPILPGPVLADRIAAGTEMGPESKRDVDEELRAGSPTVYRGQVSKEDMERLVPGSLGTLTMLPGTACRADGFPAAEDGADHFHIVDPNAVAVLLRSLGAIQAGDLVGDLYAEVLRLRGSVDLVDSERAELTELRAMRDGLRKLAAG